MSDQPADRLPGIDPADQAVVDEQLGRSASRIAEVGHRCPCGNPDVVTTVPRLPSGTPFPTTYYLTCPRAASRIGTLEGSGLMKEMEARLADDEELAAAYAAAHERYLAARTEIGRAAGLVRELSCRLGAELREPRWLLVLRGYFPVFGQFSADCSGRQIFVQNKRNWKENSNKAQRLRRKDRSNSSSLGLSWYR